MNISHNRATLLFLALAVGLSGCSEGRDGSKTGETGANGIEESFGVEKTESRDLVKDIERASFYPIGGIVPPGRVEAQNKVTAEASTEYRQLLEIDDHPRYLAELTAAAERSGFVRREVAVNHYRFARAGHQIDLRLLGSSGVGGGAKAHVVWRAETDIAPVME